MKSVTVQFPEEIVALWGKVEALEAFIKQWVYLELVRQKKITASRVAELLDIPLQDVLDLMTAHHIPWFEYQKGELEEEVSSSLAKLKRMKGKS